ncbi:MAG: hypothetical protein WAL75_14840 [Terracidiphilus sp.]
MPEHKNRDLDFDNERPGGEFDLLLRSSLETYADPGPDSGLAKRVMARIAAEGERERSRRKTRWAIALPLAACFIIAVVLLNSKSMHRSAHRIDQARVALPQSTGAGPSGPIENSPSIASRRSAVSRPLRHSSRTAAEARAERLPKLDVFPTTHPLTPEEKALVTYVAHAPEAERKSLIEEQKRLDAPLSIEALEIKPLAPPEPQGN